MAQRPLQDDRKGYVNKAVGSQGLNLLDPSHIIKEFQAREFNNATPTLGGFQSRYGFEVFNEDTTKAGGITLLHGFNKSDGTRQLVFAHDDDYYHLPTNATKTTSWNTIGDYGTASNKISAFTFADFVIFGSGVDGNDQKKWDGSSFTNVTTPPAGAGKDLSFYEFFQGQDFAALFGAGHPDNPSTLYFCDTDDPDNWGSGAAGAIDISVNDGFKITGIKAQGDQLIVYKEKNRYYVSTFYESNAGVYGIRVSPFKDNAGGTISHETIRVIRNGDIVALASQSLGLQGIGKQQAPDGSLLPKEYSRDIRTLFEQINFEIADLSRAIVYDDIIWLSAPVGPQATANNFVFRYHIDREAWDVIPNLSIACWEVFFDEDSNEVLYAGSADTAKIYKFNKNVFTDNDEKITTVFESGLINLGSVFDTEYLSTVALKGFKQQTDELLLTITIDGIETTYIIDDTFVINNSITNGYLSMDYLSTLYLGSGENVSGNIEWMAIVLIPAIQALGREVKVRIENKTKAAQWGTNWMSINEITPEQAKRLPPKFIIVNQSS